MSIDKNQAGAIRKVETPHAGQAGTRTVSTEFNMENTFLDKKPSNQSVTGGCAEAYSIKEIYGNYAQLLLRWCNHGN